MDATPSLHATWRTNRPVRLIAGAGITAALFTSVLFPVPARAITPKTAAQLTETQKKVDETSEAFDKASGKLDELLKQVDENEARIAELEDRLPAAQEKASRAMRDLYKQQKGNNTLMSLVLSTQSLDEIISTMKYMGQVQDANVDALEELNDLQTELEVEKTELASAQAKAEEEKKNAQDALTKAQSERDAAQAQADAEAAAEAAAAQAAAEAAKGAKEGGSSSATSALTGNQGLSDVDWSVGEEAFIAEWTGRIDAYLAGSPLEGYGVNFATAAWTYGVDPRWSPAISMTESTQGRHCFRSHNAWGWGHIDWPSWDVAIDAHVSGLSAGYGYTISVANARKYCPPTYMDWYNTTLGQMKLI